MRLRKRMMMMMVKELRKCMRSNGFWQRFSSPYSVLSCVMVHCQFFLVNYNCMTNYVNRTRYSMYAENVSQDPQRL